MIDVDDWRASFNLVGSLSSGSYYISVTPITVTRYSSLKLASLERRFP